MAIVRCCCFSFFHCIQWNIVNLYWPFTSRINTHDSWRRWRRQWQCKQTANGNGWYLPEEISARFDLTFPIEILWNGKSIFGEFLSFFWVFTRLSSRSSKKMEVLRFSVHSHKCLGMRLEWTQQRISRFVLTLKSVRACERWPNTTIYSISVTDSLRGLFAQCAVCGEAHLHAEWTLQWAVMRACE